MEIFYHGTSMLFKKFDISHALEGEGKAKFGFGTYVTESYTSAAHYAYNKKRPENKNYYVYTLEIPDMTDDNHLFSVRPVHPSIIERTEKALGEQIPDEARRIGKYFRKYVGNRLTGKEGTVKQLIGSADLDGKPLPSSSVRSAWSILPGHRPSQNLMASPIVWFLTSTRSASFASTR